jgi:ribosomal protein S27AE
VTSQEIKDEVLPPTDNVEFFYVQKWLKEIAYQLAVMNENYGKLLQKTINEIHSLGSPVHPDSHTEVRGSGFPQEGFESPAVEVDSIHTYQRSHPDNRFCGKCGAGEFHAIHAIPEHMRGECSNCAGLPTGPDPETICAVCRRPIARPEEAFLPGSDQP